MKIGDTTYSPLWQTWSLVQTPRSSSTHCASSFLKESELRYIVQKNRISRNMSLMTLSERTKCPLHMLSAFERGEEILDDATLRSLKRILDIP